MSYILDALKKAEQARSAGKAPDLFTLQASDPVARKPLWPWLLAGLIALNGAALYYWLVLRSPDTVQPSVVAPLPVATPPVSVARAPAPPSVPRTPAIMPVEETQPPTVLPPVTAPPKPARVAEKPAPAANPDADKPPPAAASQPKPETTAPAAPPPMDATAAPRAPAKPEPTPAPAPEQRVMPLAELPPNIQQELPKMSIAMHMYSGKPANRMASINDRTLREGDELSAGLKLVEITPDGMIFTYKGYRFKKGVQ